MTHRQAPRSARIIDSPLDADIGALFLRLQDFGTAEVYLKLEGLNPAGSVKLRPAMWMITRLEAEGRLRPGRNHVVESSSGNLGIALALVCKVKGYKFTCVTDPNVNPWAVKVMQAYGASVVVVRERDDEGGYLGTRIREIRRMLDADPHLVWTNQYANPANAGAHYALTAREIHQAFPHLDYLFVGAGTTGTLVGCARYFARHSPRTKVIAVDAVGSVTFGGPAGPRHIPGLGTSRRPEIADLHEPHTVVHVAERDAVLTCKRLLDNHGLLAGGSTGSVLAAVERYPIPAGNSVVAISPDLGDRYVDTLYDPAWVDARFPAPPGPFGVSGGHSHRPRSAPPAQPKCPQSLTEEYTESCSRSTSFPDRAYARSSRPPVPRSPRPSDAPTCCTTKAIRSTRPASS
jgi:N-(2-amino-2-carboxyethyl)-L-glutamate synthase